MFFPCQLGHCLTESLKDYLIIQSNVPVLDFAISYEIRLLPSEVKCTTQVSGAEKITSKVRVLMASRMLTNSLSQCVSFQLLS